MKISILLPYKENFTNDNAGAVSLFVNDITKNSYYKKNIEIFEKGGWHFNNILSPEEISLKLKTFAHSEFADEKFSSIKVINQQNKSRYLTKNKLFTIEDSQYINFFIVKDILKSGNIPPISYLYDRIKSTIINQRKLQLLQSLNKEILNDALKSRKYEIFK